MEEGSFHKVEGSDVREGFLCPICMKDLGDVIHLQVGVAAMSVGIGLI